MLNTLGDGHVVACVLVEQMPGGIEGGLRVSGQSAGEGILTTPLVERVITRFCAVGVLRDGELCLFLGTAQLLYAYLHAPRLLIGRTMPRGVFPTQVFSAELIGVRAAVVDHGDGVEHVVGREP